MWSAMHRCTDATTRNVHGNARSSVAPCIVVRLLETSFKKGRIQNRGSKIKKVFVEEFLWCSLRGDHRPQAPSTGLRHPSPSLCCNLLCQRFPKAVGHGPTHTGPCCQLTDSFSLVFNSSRFVKENPSCMKRFFYCLEMVKWFYTWNMYS